VIDPASRATDSPASITCVAAHARLVPGAERERFAVALRAALEGGGIVIETCHRVEGYCAGDRIPEVDVPTGTKVLTGPAAIRHAVAVAVGRDSVVIGEDQVLHQLRVAVDAARARGRLDSVLDRLFSIALRAGRRARSWRHGGERSLATVAIAALEQRSGPVQGKTILLVGAGQMGRLLARAAAASGATVIVANRSRDRAVLIAREVGGSAAPLDPGAAIASVAGVAVAIRGPWSIATASAHALGESSAPVVDLSVPAAVPADLVAQLGPRLITVDDLARLEADQPDERHLRRLDSLIEQSVGEFMAWLEGRDRRAAAAALALRADRAREEELAGLWRQLPDLDPSSRAAIDAMTRHFAERLLREPLEQLGRDADGRTERVVREVFAL
jgi:glutamyl-tRNA reductase